jgi:nitroreductase
METIPTVIVTTPSQQLWNDTIKTIYERRAVRKFKDTSVEKKLIEQVIEAGKMAPSAINKQPWKFYILTNKADIKAFSKEITPVIAKGILKSGIKGIIKTAKELLHFSHGSDFFKGEDPIFHGAPVVVFITSPKDNEWATLDIGMCAQNIMLAAKAIGLDTCPVGLGKFVEKTKIYSRLNVPATEQVNLAIVMGYGSEAPEAKERITNNVTFL